MKRRQAKSKGEKERYTHLNAELQSIARRDKKDFLSDQCKEIEENNRRERLEISSRKLEISRNISYKDGLNKGQKWYGPNRSRRLRGGKNTQKNCAKKIFKTQIIMKV